MYERRCSLPKCICERRVLVIDNDPQFRADHVKNLTGWGYTVYVAAGKGMALLHDAQQKAHHHCCHVAIVDMRLRDDDDRSDQSGLELVPLLMPTRSILVTAFGNMQVAREALIKKGAWSAVGKQEGPQALHSELQAALADVCGPARKITWPAGWQPQHIAELLLDPVAAATSQQEANDIITQLFPNAEHVALHCLDDMAHVPPTALPPTRSHSLVFLALEDTKAPIVLKFMATGKTRREKSNYECYIQGQLGVVRYAQLQESVSLWNLGASTYLFVGETDSKQIYAGRSFTQLYRSMSASADIMTPLRHFFATIWSKYYHTAEPSDSSLFQLYDTPWEGALSQQFHIWRELDEQISFLLPAPTLLLNPLRWLAVNADLSNLYGFKQTVVHGDFHGDNLLIDHSYYPWIIDFEHTGKQHILRDFVQITQDTLTRTAELPAGDLMLLYELAIALAAPETPHQPLPATQRIMADNEAHKAFETLQQIRHLAYDQTRYGDSREFLWGLLFNTLFVAALPRKPEAVRNKSLLLGSVLAQRLSLWGRQAWPPANWPSVQWETSHAT